MHQLLIEWRQIAYQKLIVDCKKGAGFKQTKMIGEVWHASLEKSLPFQMLKEFI